MPLPLMMDAFEDGGSCRPGSAASVTTSSRGIQIQERARGGREPRYHHYVFELFALDRELDLPPTAGRAEPLAAMNGNVIAKAAYVARFRRAH
jgi:phosphatidylethanolamine-binding protein (PEBP) family uncharacterized protein